MSNKNKEETDAFGHALLDYIEGKHDENISVISNITEKDIIPVRYLFRSIKEFPEIEKKAIDLCKGRVLDVGAGSGCHALELKKKGLKVKAIDISPGAVEVIKKRGIIDVEEYDFFTIENLRFDTIIFLMNGVGIAQTLDRLPSFLKKAKSMLNSGGQILLDSSDISYLFTEEDGSLWVNLNQNYYGEVVYQMEYKESKTKKFGWLFVDFDTLKLEASKVGLNTEMVLKGTFHNYLARLTISNV